MNQEICISGTIQPYNQAFKTLVGLLDGIGVHATHPTDESFYINSQHPAWHHYDTQLALYESIAHAPFHILFNDGAITEDVARQMLYAILKERPVLMTGSPVFDDSISLFSKDILRRHVPLFHSINLPALEQTEIASLITRLSPVDYMLNESEKVLIQSRVKAHFRRLLDEARDIYVEKY
jgi:hypothetical protein